MFLVLLRLAILAAVAFLLLRWWWRRGSVAHDRPRAALEDGARCQHCGRALHADEGYARGAARYCEEHAPDD